MEMEVEKGSEKDTLLSPHYYKHGSENEKETIDYIEAVGLNFALGNVLKYVSRAGRKGRQKTERRVEDLKKARAYLTREINRLEGNSDWDYRP